jgi:hypothetical protein
MTCLRLRLRGFKSVFNTQKFRLKKFFFFSFGKQIKRAIKGKKSLKKKKTLGISLKNEIFFPKLIFTYKLYFSNAIINRLLAITNSDGQ